MRGFGLLVAIMALLVVVPSGCSRDDETAAAVDGAKAPTKVKRKRVRPQDKANGEKADPAVTEGAKAEGAKAEGAKAGEAGSAAEIAAIAEPIAADPTATVPAEGVAAAALAPAGAAVENAEIAGAAAAVPAATDIAAANVAAGPPAMAADAPAAVDPAAPGAPPLNPAGGDDDEASKTAEAAAREAAEAAAKALAIADPQASDVVAPALRGETKPIEPSLEIGGFLTLRDLEHVFSKKKTFLRGNLPGVEPSKSHNTLYFEPQRGDAFGVAVQVWRDLNLIDSRTRFNTLKNTSTNVVTTAKVVGDQGFRSYFGGVVTLTFADARLPIVASVSCGIKTCEANDLVALALRVAERLR